MISMIVVVLFVAAQASTQFTPELDDQWESFKVKYNKHYDEQEHLTRRLIWEKNLRYIQKHNLEADRGLHTFRLGENEYADMTNSEFRAKMNGYVMSNEREQGEKFRPQSVGSLPKSVDWREKGYVTRVKNQGQCGSCWAFSTTGSLEGQTFKKTGKLVSLSEQNLMDCSWKQGNKGCKGGLMTKAFNYIQANGGIDTDASYPYTMKNESCKFTKENIGATDAGGYEEIEMGSESDLQSAVATIGPISVAIDAGHSSFQLYKSGVYEERQCSSIRLDHGVLAVGYGEEGFFEKKHYWIVKNSWGESWGMEGYIWMARNKDNMCGIATQACYPKV